MILIIMLVVMKACKMSNYKLSKPVCINEGEFITLVNRANTEILCRAYRNQFPRHRIEREEEYRTVILHFT